MGFPILSSYPTIQNKYICVNLCFLTVSYRIRPPGYAVFFNLSIFPFAKFKTFAFQPNSFSLFRILNTRLPCKVPVDGIIIAALTSTLRY